jgi:hypothetical protein
MTPRRYELSDFEWSIIEPLLPNKPRGVPRVDNRRALNGIYRRMRTGSPGPIFRSATPTPRQPRLGTTLEPSSWGVREAA